MFAQNFAVGSDSSEVLEPPTSFLRKPRKSVKSHLWKPTTRAALGCDQPLEASKRLEVDQRFDRSRHNRLIGEMIQGENLIQCDDLPSLDQLGYSDEFFRSMSTLEKKN
jgi:hypothetical protein